MRYPIGNQDFRTIRQGDFAYVDKTRQICAVANAGSYFFLSRPRRFGKSLTVSTLHELYSGDRELFKGLWAYDNWSFAERQRPVIWIRFASTGFQTIGLEATLSEIIDDEADRLGVSVEESENYAARLNHLVQAVAKGHPSGRCVVLIDEYDKPIINDLGNSELAKKNRYLLRPFYGVLKDADEYIELVFITGVSAFSKVSLFSDLNNVRQLTLDPLAHTLVGLTEGELDANFSEQLDATGYSRDDIREWYNGYTWGGEKVYNPWSILQLLATGERENYWSQSGTPNFITDYIAKQGIYNLSGEHRTASQLMGFNLDRLDPAAVLWQGGYLSLGEKLETLTGATYELKYPNLEVRTTFLDDLIGSYGFGKVHAPANHINSLYLALQQEDFSSF